MVSSTKRQESALKRINYEKLQSDILTFLSLNPMNSYTARDIANVFYGRCNAQKCSAMLHKLVQTGKVRKLMYNQRSYFTVRQVGASSPKPNMCKTSIDNYQKI